MLVILMTHSVLVSCWLSSTTSRAAHRLSTRGSSSRLCWTRALSGSPAARNQFPASSSLPSRFLQGQQHHQLQQEGRSSLVVARFMSSSSRATTLQDEEQDLDAALDTILGDHATQSKRAANVRLSPSSNEQTSSKEQHMGKPMPQTLIEQVRGCSSCVRALYVVAFSCLNRSH